MAKDISDVYMGMHHVRCDKKTRIGLPSAFKKTMHSLTEGDEGEQYGIAMSPDKTHLVILPLRALFQQAAEGKENTPAHSVAPFCKPLKLDSADRILIGQDRSEQLGIDEDNRDLVIVGAFNRIEIWPKKTWDEVEEQRRIDEARPVFGEGKSDPEPGG